MEPPDQIEAPQLVRVGRLAALEKIRDHLDDAAPVARAGNSGARTCDGAGFPDRMCMDDLRTD